MYERALKQELLKALNYYPVVTLTGPRQSGKTTLIKQTFPDFKYFNLEDLDILEQIKLDPKGFLVSTEQPIIIDEIQNFPKLLSYIQVIVDESNRKFILTASNQFNLLSTINQSLAGRTDLLTLYPLTLSEIKEIKPDFSLEDWLLSGFYPRLHFENIPAERNSKNYIKTYIERDVRKIINIKDISNFQKLVKICASRVGQVLNINSICNELGISHNTIKAWLAVLEASYIIYFLQPYHNNFNKRVIKSPKLYFIDVGLVCNLLGIKEKSHINYHPLKGNIYENMIVMDLIKIMANKGLEADLYFYRDNNQNEVDLIWENANELIPIEIKLSATFNKSFLKGINYFMSLCNRASHAYLIYSGEPVIMNSKIKLLNYKNLEKII